MAHIVKGIKTKKEFKAIVAASDGNEPYLFDPSWFTHCRYNGPPIKAMVEYGLFRPLTVTNEKRTWFAQLTMTKDGKVKVS